MHDMKKMPNERQNPTVKGISYHITENGKNHSYKYRKLHPGCSIVIPVKSDRSATIENTGPTDEDMTTLDTTKNIAYMYICEVISSANYAKIYLCHPGQK